MAREAVFCIALSADQAEAIVLKLRDAGFSNNDVSVLYPDHAGPRDFAYEKHSKAPEYSLAGVCAGAILGGLAAWAMRHFALPGSIFLVAAGPFFATLSGAALGALIGGVIGLFRGRDVPEYEAKRYQGKIQDGNILISVHAESEALKRLAERIFWDYGANDIAAAKEARVISRRKT